MKTDATTYEENAMSSQIPNLIYRSFFAWCFAIARYVYGHCLQWSGTTLRCTHIQLVDLRNC